ncbi:hypothetical protein BC829DRAFT_449233 [Chytridium lagenaria]|nr:hypothetical protein BC829DRAFT_449233 [Chytridium lagenaria]
MSTTTTPSDCLFLRSFLPSTLIPETGTCCTPSSTNPITCVSNRITSINIQSTDLSAITIPSLTPLTELRTLILFNVSLSGPIPEFIRGLDLTTLTLGRNAFNGDIPDWIGEMGSLTTLYLFNNALGGRLPESLFGLRRLENLAVDNNALSGVVSERIGELGNLRNLWLRNNQFVGPIPVSLGNLRNLNQTYLADNFFGGEPIPEFMYTVNASSLNNNCMRRSDINSASQRYSRYVTNRIPSACITAFTSASLTPPADFATALIQPTAASLVATRPLSTTFNNNDIPITPSSLSTGTDVGLLVGAIWDRLHWCWW